LQTIISKPKNTCNMIYLMQPIDLLIEEEAATGTPHFNAIMQEGALLQSRLLRLLHSCTGRKQLRDTLRLQQECLVRYANMLDEAYPGKDWCLPLQDHLVDLLELLHKHFTRYFDNRLVVPAAWLRTWAGKAVKKTEALLPVLQQLYPDCAALLLQPLTELPPVENCSYNRLLLLQHWAHALALLCGKYKEAAQPRRNKALLWAIIRCNMNTPELVNLCRLLMEEMEITATAPPPVFWKQLQEQVATIVCHNNTVLSPCYKSAGRQLLYFIELKMEAMEEAAKEEQARLHTSLSVPQLALLIRLLAETGIVESDSQLELLRRFALLVVTRRVQSISAESLRVKYYAPEKAAITIMRDRVVQMLNLLKGY
jgi:hypothetical protein